MQYFFYGTLCDPDIRRLVLGYTPSRRQLRPARLTGFRRKAAQDRLYPILVPSPAGCVDGVLFRAARPADSCRLADYEGSEYRTRQLPVRTRNAAGSRRVTVFLPADLRPSHRDWHLARWRRLHKSAFLRSLQMQGPVPCANP